MGRSLCEGEPAPHESRDRFSQRLLAVSEAREREAEVQGEVDEQRAFHPHAPQALPNTGQHKGDNSGDSTKHAAVIASKTRKGLQDFAVDKIEPAWNFSLSSSQEFV